MIRLIFFVVLFSVAFCYGYKTNSLYGRNTLYGDLIGSELYGGWYGKGLIEKRINEKNGLYGHYGGPYGNELYGDLIGSELYAPSYGKGLIETRTNRKNVLYGGLYGNELYGVLPRNDLYWGGYGKVLVENRLPRKGVYGRGLGHSRLGKVKRA